MKTKNEYLEFAKTVAERRAVEILNNDCNMVVEFCIDIDKPRAIMMPMMGPTFDRNKVGWAITVLGAAIDDLWALVFTTDSYHVRQGTKRDGTPWGPGDMERAVRQKTEDADLIFEALNCQFAEVGGGMASVLIPYDRTETEIKFKWDEAQCMISGEEGNQVGGFYVDVMREALDAPKIMGHLIETGMPPESLGLDMEVARMHTICAGVKHIMRTAEVGILVPCYSEMESEILQRSMSDMEGISVFDEEQVDEIVSLQEQFNGPSAER